MYITYRGGEEPFLQRNKTFKIVLPVSKYGSEFIKISCLQKKAALKTKPEKLLSVEDARVYSKKLIRKWAQEK